jgi:hypothetical protein
MTRSKLFVAVLSLFLLVAATVGAQIWETKATVKVPFDFVVNGKVLPAGEYVLVRHGFVWLIQNVETRVSAIVGTRNIILNPPDSTSPETKLVFVADAGQHVLHQIWLDGVNYVHDLVHDNEVVELPGTSR